MNLAAEFAAHAAGWTVDEWAELVEQTNLPIELDKGNLIVQASPTWRHQRVVSLLERTLEAAADGLLALPGVGLVEPGGDPNSARIPDLVVCREPRGLRVAPDEVLIAIEVLSSSTTETDTLVKPKLYAGWGIPFYWLVDQDERRITCFMADRKLPYAIVNGSGRIDQPFPVDIPATVFDLG